MKKGLILIATILMFFSCQKEKISFSTSADDVFFLENEGASMRIEVQGNTGSKVFVILVHGGPGATAYLYDKNYIKNHLEKTLAMVFWDQRNAGASQGNNNGSHLHLNQMVEDLRKVIQLIKYRYGQDIRVYILGHSWGGLITSAFITEDRNQDMIRGWICVDGSHNFPLNDTLTRNKLLNTGEQQVALHKNEDKWKEIIGYCRAHTGNFTLAESDQLQDYAGTAETLMDSAKQVSALSYLRHYVIQNDFPLTSIAVNYLYSNNASINQEVSKAEYSSVMFRVTVPVLLLWGKYDFICPEGLADDIYKRVSSSVKRKVVSPITGHNMMLLDQKLFCDEVAAFVEQNP